MTAQVAPRTVVSIERYDRMTAARPEDANNTGPVRARQPATTREIRRLFHGGATARAIAEQFGLSVRTIYRYLREGETFRVTIGRWSALCELRADESPIRVSPWTVG